MIDFIEIIERIKLLHNVKKDKEIADIMGVSQQSITNWKNRNKIPFEELISYCLKENINMKYLLTGQKEENFVNFKEENLKIINESDEKTQEKIYHLLKSQIC